jgi:hypothetical protein
MWVIFLDISPGVPGGPEMGESPAMRLLDLCLIGAHARPGEPPVRLGVPLLDEYLRFLSGRCRPNTGVGHHYPGDVGALPYVRAARAKSFKPSNLGSLILRS